MRTKDRAEAKRKVALETVRTNALLEQAEAASEPQLSEAKIRWQEEQRRQEECAARIAAQAEDAQLLRVKITGATEEMHPADAVIARAIREAEADSTMWRSISEDH